MAPCGMEETLKLLSRTPLNSRRKRKCLAWAGQEVDRERKEDSLENVSELTVYTRYGKQNTLDTLAYLKSHI